MVTRVGAWLAVLSGITAVAFTGYLWRLSRPELLSSLSTGRDAATVLGWGALGVLWAATGAVLISARPRNGLGWLLLAVGLSQAWHVGLIGYSVFGLTVAADPWPGALWAGYAGGFLFVLGVLVPPTLLLVLYPEGHMPSRWWWWPVGAAGLAALHIATKGLFVVFGDTGAGHGMVLVPDFMQGVPSRLLPPSARFSQPVSKIDEALPGWVDAFHQEFLPVPSSVWVPLFVSAALTIWIGTLVRLLHTRPPQRQQLAWLACLVMPSLALSWLAPSQGRIFAVCTLVLVPIAVAVGVLRYQLLGIETVLRRGLLYGALTATVFGVYLALTALAGRALQKGPFLGVFAAALVAVGLAPARNWLQRGVDRLVYGEQRDPLGVMHRLGQRVASPDVDGELELLASALSNVAEAVRAPGAAVLSPDGQIRVRVGGTAASRMVLPLAFGGQPIGNLQVEEPPGGERYTDDGKRLLAVLAVQIAVIVRALDLTEALEAEHDRVLGATMTERDRLRRDLHDGLGPSLSGVGLGLQALEDRLGDADAATRALVDRIRDEIGTASGDVRRIIDDLRPTALDTAGLCSAIRRHAETLTAVLAVEVDAPPLGRVPPLVENVAYRITTEALTNVARHAGARHVRVAVTADDGSLRIRVADDGRGVGWALAGVGLTSMRQRAEALGGELVVDSTADGTTVTATLPLEEP